MTCRERTFQSSDYQFTYIPVCGNIYLFFAVSTLLKRVEVHTGKHPGEDYTIRLDNAYGRT